MIRAYVHEDIIGLNIAVSLVMHPEPGCIDMKPRVLHFGDGGNSWARSWDEVPEDGSLDRPTFRLDHEQARAVLDALTVLFQGAEDTRALRRDYDAERKRVDQLAGTLSTLALKLAEPA
jgi:hypothetical protein